MGKFDYPILVTQKWWCWRVLHHSLMESSPDVFGRLQQTPVDSHVTICDRFILNVFCVHYSCLANDTEIILWSLNSTFHDTCCHSVESFFTKYFDVYLSETPPVFVLTIMGDHQLWKGDNTTGQNLKLLNINFQFTAYQTIFWNQVT